MFTRLKDFQALVKIVELLNAKIEEQGKQILQLRERLEILDNGVVTPMEGRLYKLENDLTNGRYK